MAYLGNVPARSFISFERQVFTIVNSQTVYTLSHSVTNENDIRLVINNIVQEPGSGKAYTASGTTLTLSAALVNGTDEMYCVFLGRAVGTVNAPAGSVAASQLAADSVTAAKLNDDIISGQTELASGPADTDEFLVSDAGTLKRIDYSLIKGTIKKITVNENINTQYGSLSSDTTLTDYNVTHTALSTSNKLAFLISIPYVTVNANVGITNLRINDGSSDIISGLYYNYKGNTGTSHEMSLVAMKFDHTPASTNAITYTLKAVIYRPSGSNTVTIGSSSYPGRVVCVEY